MNRAGWEGRRECGGREYEESMEGEREGESMKGEVGEVL